MNRKNLAPANEVAFTKLQSELQSTVALLRLPQEKRPLKILETKPKILKKILFDHEDGLEGESDIGVTSLFQTTSTR